MNGPDIFIVDDDQGHAVLLENSLRDSGILNNIRWFSTGNDALECLFDDELRMPMVVLLDLNMPGISGTEVLKEIRLHEKTQGLPVIVLTSTSQSREVEECYRLGCNLYLSKPVQHEEFVSAIHTLGLMFKIASLPGAEEEVV